jgi:hypothetical protein
VLSPLVGPTGTAVRTAQNTLGAKINNAVPATMALDCADTDTFVVTGGQTMGCEELLRAMGYHPRHLNTATPFATLHAGIQRPVDYLKTHGVPSPTEAQVNTMITNVSTYLHGLNVGKIMVENDTTPGTFMDIAFQYYMCDGDYTPCSTVYGPGYPY